MPWPAGKPEKDPGTLKAIEMIMTNAFFHDWLWWLLLAAAIAAASVPSLFRPLRKIRSTLSASLWLLAITLMWVHHGTAAALAGMLGSFCTGILVFLLVLFYS